MFGSDSDFEPDADGQLEHDHTNDGDGGSADGGKSMENVECEEGNADARVAVAANDVNVMADGELDNSGDEVIERREYPDDTFEPDEDVAHMDDAFVEGLGGKITLEEIDKDAIRRFAWSAPSSELEPDSGDR
ncbi:hypothetical protein JG688_00018264, partial [Phytophthora aleatoria]